MFLFLVRHAHAVTEEEDSTRPLSSRGISTTHQLADFFRQNGAFIPVQVWHSPLRRSRETAEILARALHRDAVLVETPGLLPEDDVGEIAEHLASFTSTQPLAIVGHEPHLSALATLLVRGKPHPAAFTLKKAAVLALERTHEVHKKSGEPRWIVNWQIAPSLLPPRDPQPIIPAIPGNLPIS